MDVYLLQFRLSVSDTSSQSSSSPLSGKGFMHVLLLVWFSWREHSVHSVHCVQYPLTNDKWSEHMRAVSGDINCCSVENCLRVHTTLFCLNFSFIVQLSYYSSDVYMNCRVIIFVKFVRVSYVTREFILWYNSTSCAPKPVNLLITLGNYVTIFKRSS